MKNFSKSHLQSWGLDLVAKYPLVFIETDAENSSWARRAGIMDEDYVNLRYGFECGEGWKGKIEEIAKKGSEIVTYLRGSNLRCVGISPEDVYIHSCIVKEKFGGLRWQGTFKLPPLFQELWYSFVNGIENNSYQVCELTGTFGSVRRTKNGEASWVRTLCTEKAIEKGYDLEDWEKEKIERQKNPKPVEEKKHTFTIQVPSTNEKI